MLSYNRANRAVAILCNHQRAIPKTHDKSMANLQEKIEAKKEQQAKAEKDFKSAKKAAKANKSQNAKIELDKKRKALERAMEQLDKLNTQVSISIYRSTHQDRDYILLTLILKFHHGHVVSQYVTAFHTRNESLFDD